MLVPTWMGIKMADGNQQKHLLPSFGTKAWIYSETELEWFSLPRTFSSLISIDVLSVQLVGFVQ